MGFNKALGQQQVGLGRDPVDDALAAGRKRADLLHGLVVGGDVHDDLLLMLSMFIGPALDYFAFSREATLPSRRKCLSAWLNSAARNV